LGQKLVLNLKSKKLDEREGRDMKESRSGDIRESRNEGRHFAPERNKSFSC
jgi:hypothetical protein